MADALDIRKQLIRVAKEVKRSSQEIIQYIVFLNPVLSRVVNGTKDEAKWSPEAFKWK